VKKIFALAAVTLMLSNVQAQDNPADLEVVLPYEAQKCVLPASPDKIPEEATLDELKAAKTDVADFQAAMVEYRSCLDAANSDEDLTPGNKQAIVNSYNYSVEMEERVANRFNEAVRAFKERQAASG
jgi:hypothetical protein